MPTDAAPSVLLSTVCRPFGEAHESDSVQAELFHAQITRAQGIFSSRQVMRCWGLDYIAHNIQSPTTVLHYPSKREFLRELKSGHYDYVGISFVVATFHKVCAMARWIRRHAPGATIVLGGYGTVLPDHVLKPVSDQVCRGEGIAFMRRLLGEDESRPIELPYAPIPSPRIYSYQVPSVVATITGGLGCPNGCDFCCTSHYFQRRYIPFLKTGRELYDTIRAMYDQAARRGDTIGSIGLIDEDFFLNKPRALEYLQCVREWGKPLSIFAFGSVRSLSQYDPDDIAEMGFDIIWTGFEGSQSGYAKRDGKSFAEVYAALKARGIAVLSSMIIGFPEQTEEQIQQDFDYLMSLKPSYFQALIYFAFPGTPLHTRAIREGWYLPEYQDKPDLRTWDGFRMHFKHTHFAPEQVERLQRRLYREDFHRLGPSLVRCTEVWFDGYKQLRRSARPLLRARAERLARLVRDKALPGLYPAILFGPNRARRLEARRLFDAIQDELGPLSFRERVVCGVLAPLSGWTWLSGVLNIFQQPALLRIEYNTPTARRERMQALRLQGGFQANPLVACCEDTAHNLRKWYQTLLGSPQASAPDLRPEAITTPHDQATR